MLRGGLWSGRRPIIGSARSAEPGANGEGQRGREAQHDTCLDGSPRPAGRQGEQHESDGEQQTADGAGAIAFPPLEGGR